MALLVRESQRRRTKGFFKLKSLQLEENQTKQFSILKSAKNKPKNSGNDPNKS